MADAQQAHGIRLPVHGGVVLAQPALDLGVLGVHAEDLVRRVHRRGFVVLTIREHRVVDPDGALGECEDLEGERRVLKSRARRGQKTDPLALEEVAPIDGRPDRGLLVKDERRRRGVDGLAADLGTEHLVELAALLGLRPKEVEVALGHLSIRRAGRCHELLERIGRHEVIGLEHAHVLATCRRKTAVHGVAVTGVGLVDHAKARVALHELANDLGTAVAGTVVDADDLDVLERLGSGGIEALPEIALHVVDGNEERDGRGFALLHVRPFSR